MRTSKAWVAVDAAMAVAILLLMAYSLVGEFAHECLGVGTFLLFLAHIRLNRRRVKALLRGCRDAGRALRAVIMLALAGTFALTAATGIATSHHLFIELTGPLDTPLLEVAHMTAAHWAFVLAGVHLGLHWKKVASTLPRLKDPSAGPAAIPSASRAVQVLKALCVFAFVVICVAAFMDRGIWRYLLGLNHFALIDFTEPVWHCVAEYLLSAALFVGIGRVAGDIAGRLAKRRRRGNGIDIE